MKRLIPIFFLLYATTFCLSFAAHVIPWLNPVLFTLYSLLFIVLTFRKLEYGFYMLFASLFVDSFGYIFAWNGISLRIAMAGILMTFIAVRLIRQIKFIIHEHKPYKTLFIVYALLMLWLMISFINGWIQNGFQNAFLDFNGFLFLLLLPITLITTLNLQMIATILKASLLWTFILVSLTEFFFSRWNVVPVLYTFIRDTRFGEITPAFGNFYRIFLQSEVYAVVGLLLAIAAIASRSLTMKLSQTPTPVTTKVRLFCFARNDIINDFGLLFISVTILLISLSRSFWVGSSVAILLCAVNTFRSMRLNEWIKSWFRTALVVIVGGIFVMLVSNTGLGAQRVIRDRVDISEPAASSRSAQLHPLHSAIRKSPVIGYGFGKELEYQSSDPRRIEQSRGTGLVKTWAFELGWHDLTLKTGSIGSILYLSFIIILMRSLWLRIKNQESRIKNGFPHYSITLYSLPFTLCLSLLALIIIHIFTPYLNHPLGIGVLLLAFIGIQKNAVDSKDQSMVL